jgi:hypothetical protein
LYVLLIGLKEIIEGEGVEELIVILGVRFLLLQGFNMPAD